MGKKLKRCGRKLARVGRRLVQCCAGSDCCNVAFLQPNVFLPASAFNNWWANTVRENPGTSFREAPAYPCNILGASGVVFADACWGTVTSVRYNRGATYSVTTRRTYANGAFYNFDASYATDADYNVAATITNNYATGIFRGSNRTNDSGNISTFTNPLTLDFGIGFTPQMPSSGRRSDWFYRNATRSDGQTWNRNIPSLTVTIQASPVFSEVFGNAPGWRAMQENFGRENDTSYTVRTEKTPTDVLNETFTLNRSWVINADGQFQFSFTGRRDWTRNYFREVYPGPVLVPAVDSGYDVSAWSFGGSFVRTPCASTTLPVESVPNIINQIRTGTIGRTAVR